MRQILYFLFVISFFIFSTLSAYAKDNVKVIDGDTIHRQHERPAKCPAQSTVRKKRE